MITASPLPAVPLGRLRDPDTITDAVAAEVLKEIKWPEPEDAWIIAKTRYWLKQACVSFIANDRQNLGWGEQIAHATKIEAAARHLLTLLLVSQAETALPPGAPARWGEARHRLEEAGSALPANVEVLPSTKLRQPGRRPPRIALPVRGSDDYDSRPVRDYIEAVERLISRASHGQNTLRSLYGQPSALAAIAGRHKARVILIARDLPIVFDMIYPHFRDPGYASLRDDFILAASTALGERGITPLTLKGCRNRYRDAARKGFPPIPHGGSGACMLPPAGEEGRQSFWVAVDRIEGGYRKNTPNEGARGRSESET